MYRGSVDKCEARLEATEPWHVLHVKSRQEKLLAQDLTAMGISHYLPLVVQERYYGRRKLVSQVPLFSGWPQHERREAGCPVLVG